MEEGGYSPKQMFNIDETGLFWKRTSRGRYISREEKITPGGFKGEKDRFTLMLGGDAEGDCTLKPFMVYHSENPRDMKGYVKKCLPVHRYSNTKGWITGIPCVTGLSGARPNHDRDGKWRARNYFITHYISIRKAVNPPQQVKCFVNILSPSLLPS